jgi:uncharacterized protein YciI
VCLILSLMLSNGAVAETDQVTRDIYDKQLAAELGADDYGMKSYVMVVLNTGPNDAVVTDKKEREKLFAGHFSNMDRLAEEGKLVFAGPFIDGKPKRGLYIFAVKSIEEAEALVKTDPTVEAGIFIYEMTKLYGSAALMQVAETHKKITKP